MLVPASILLVSSQRWPIVVLVILGLLPSVYWLYRPQVKLTGRAWRWVLPGLRLLVLAVLALSILQPVLVFLRSERERGTIVVLVDNSRSMSVADAVRGGGERISVARALGQLPPDASSAMQSLLRDVEEINQQVEAIGQARSELEYSRLSGRGVEASEERSRQAMAKLQLLAATAADHADAVADHGTLPKDLRSLAEARVDAIATFKPRMQAIGIALASLRASTDQQLYRSDATAHEWADRLNNMTRAEMAQLAISAAPGSLLRRLPAEIPVRFFAVGDKVTPLPVPDRNSPSTRPVNPDAPASDLTGAVRTVLDALADETVRAVVLYSDGHQVSGDSAATSTTASAIPIFTVAVASPVGVKDLSLSGVSVAESAFVGETLTVRAQVISVGFANVETDVTMDCNGQKQVRHVTLAGDKPMPVEFTQKLTAAGPTRIAIDVAARPGEASVENNHVERYVKVLQQKVKVAIYSGAAGWDYQYIRNGLSRTAWVELKDGILADDGAKFPLGEKDILKQDVVILCDLAVKALSPEQWAALNQLVVDRGGSVMLLAGDAHLPGEYSSSALTSAFLPYLPGNSPAWRTWPGERPQFHMIPSPAAAMMDALRFEDAPDEAQKHWHTMPGFYRYLPLPALKPNARVLLIEADTTTPVMTESRLGLGRVFFAGFDETWRWRYRIGEKDQDRFWRQMIRHAAEEPYSATEGGLSIDASLVSAAVGQPVSVRGRLLKEDGSAIDKATCELEILQGGSVIRRQPMNTAPESRAGRFETTVSGLESGDYTLRLNAGGSLPEPSIPLSVRRSEEAELADLSGDETMLRRLSQMSGGRFYRLDQVEALPDALAQAGDEHARYAERTLWDSPQLFGLVLGILAVEWALRKRLGLA